MNGFDCAIADLAESQFAVFSRAQAREVGFSDAAIARRIASGAWVVIHPSVYRLPGAPQTGRQRAMAAQLWGGKHAVISHTTSGRILRLDRVQAEAVHLTLPARAGRRNDALTIHHTDTITRADRVTVDGIACTSATRTIIDCASLLDDEALEVAFESARRMGLTSPQALAKRASELCRRGKAGASRMTRLLAHQRPGDPALQYRLEVKTEALLRESNLPPFERQHPVGPYRIDFARPEIKFGVECDGFEHHGYRLAWKRDRRRIAAIEHAGWRLIIVTWDDVTRYPRQTVERIALNLSCRS